MLVNKQERKVEIQYLDNLSPIIDDGQDVVQGLTSIAKSLPPKYFYDRLGSELFEQICLLPEYYPTRTETAILQKASQEIAEITGVCELVELGSGSSRKTRLLLSAYDNLGQSWQYIPIDVSSEMLKNTALQLHQEYSYLSILGLVGTYEQALSQLPPVFSSPRMIIFLGSTLGNFTQQESDRLFNQVREILNPGDYFLLGIDLHKPTEILEAAYNDRQGITADFNLNILSHLNRRFDGNFDLDLFEHQAIYNQEKQQIEMYLSAQKEHKVRLDKLDLNLNFTKQETILTEISRKFEISNMREYLREHKLNYLQHWTDKNELFSLILTQIN